MIDAREHRETQARERARGMTADHRASDLYRGRWKVFDAASPSQFRSQRAMRESAASRQGEGLLH
jgi:hypothetical protein